MDVNRLGNPGTQAPPSQLQTAGANAQTVAQTPIAPMPAPVETRETSSEPDPLSRAVTAVNTSIASYSRHMSIKFHEPTGRRIVTVYDSETNEAVREIPPERVLDAHASLLELAGLFMDQRG